jgi:hypothetical protein
MRLGERSNRAQAAGSDSADALDASARDGSASTCAVSHTANRTVNDHTELDLDLSVELLAIMLDSTGTAFRSVEGASTRMVSGACETAMTARQRSHVSPCIEWVGDVVISPAVQ